MFFKPIVAKSDKVRYNLFVIPLRGNLDVSNPCISVTGFSFYTKLESPCFGQAVLFKKEKNIMSKSIALIVFSVLIGIAAITGMSTNLSGRLKHAFSANSASAHLSVGGKAVMMSKNQAPSNGLGTFGMPSSMSSPRGAGHDCHSDSTYNPLDE